MTHSRPTIFLFSLEPWGDMWYSKHHYAAHLAKTHEVYFISLPDRWRWTDLFSFKVKVRSVPEGLKVVEYRNNLPLRFLPNWLADPVARMNALKLRKLVPSGKVIHWCFHPTRVLDHRTLRNQDARIIYHVVDPYQGLRNDRAFAKKSDVVVAINSWYMVHYGKLNPNCILVPHGVRLEDRTHDPAVVRSHKQKWGRYAILATGLNHFVNYALLYRTATKYTDIRFVIAGQLFPLEAKDDAIRDKIFALPNVTYLGVKHPNELKDLVHGAEVGLLTYDLEPTLTVPLTAARTPLKVLTYLAQHCPVVSTNNSYVPILEDNGHFKAENEDHFVELVGEVLDGRARLDLDVVDRYLDDVEYGKLIRSILERLDEVGQVKDENGSGPQLAPKVEVTGMPMRPVIPKNSPVMIISNEEWHGPRYSKHRYAIALNALRTVYFIDPPSPWRPSHLFRPGIRKRTTPEGIIAVSYKNAIPLFGGKLGSFNDRIIAKRLRRFFEREGETAPLFWTFDPSRLSVPTLFNACRSVYHCADDHAFRWRGERKLANQCDHVFCIAKELMPRFAELNASVHHVPHGLAESDMTPKTSVALDLSSGPGYGLYIGNINDRHDFALWEKLFKAHPDLTWIVVGPVNVTDPIGRRLIDEKPYPNVIFKAPVTYPQLRELISGASFGFLYMRRDHPANRISSQKLVQFLAMGKPVFCSWFSEYADRADLVHMTDDHEEAMTTFAAWRASGEASDAVEQRLRFAREQRFDKLLEKLPFRF